jgi:hypothetical protein
LFFAAPDGAVMPAEITSGASFQSGPPKTLFNSALVQDTQSPFTVLLNWESTLPR